MKEIAESELMSKAGVRARKSFKMAAKMLKGERSGEMSILVDLIRKLLPDKFRFMLVLAKRKRGKVQVEIGANMKAYVVRQVARVLMDQVGDDPKKDTDCNGKPDEWTLEG